MAVRLTQLRTKAVAAGFAVTSVPAQSAEQELDRLARAANLNIHRLRDLFGIAGSANSQAEADPATERLLEGACGVSAGGLR